MDAPAPLTKRVLRFGQRALLRAVPRTPGGDRLVHFLRFMVRHRRLPGRGMLFNDVLYRCKTTTEIREPLRLFVSDKEYVKLYVRAVVGEAHNVPTIAVLRSMEAVERYDFPSDCCIKPTHASGQVLFRRNGAPVDLDLVRQWFATNYYDFRREYNYRDLRPKLIVEPIVFGDMNAMDYKIFCREGVPRLIQVDLDRRIGHTRRFFDTDWNALDFSVIYPRSDRTVARPANLDRMLAVAAALSEPFPFVRIDLYSDGTDCFVGEITNCSENADGVFVPREAERQASELVFG